MTEEQLALDIQRYGRDSFLAEVARGRMGHNEGLPNGLKKINGHIHNTQRSRYYLIGADSNVGKSTFMDYAFVLTPYEWAKQAGVKVNWLYFSFEIAKSAKRSGWASKIINNRYNLRLPVAYILSRGKFRVSDEHWQLCVAINDELEELMGAMNMVDEPITPSAFRKALKYYAEQKGKFVYETYQDSDGVEKERICDWIPHDPTEHHIIAMDHIAYADMERGFTKKQNMDTISQTCVYFRNRCNFTFAIIQQFNTELSSIERQKFKKGAIAPQRVDFGDSTYTYRDADVVLGLLKPALFDFNEFMGYDVTQLRENLVFLYLMKNRHDGMANVVCPLFMDPVLGTFKDLPSPVNPMGLEIYYELSEQFFNEQKQLEQ